MTNETTLKACPIPDCGGKADPTYSTRADDLVGCSVIGCLLHGDPMSRRAWQALPRRSEALGEVWVRYADFDKTLYVVHATEPTEDTLNTDKDRCVCWVRVPVHGAPIQTREEFAAPGFPMTCSFCGGSHSYIVVGPRVCICVSCAQQAVNGSECGIPQPESCDHCGGTLDCEECETRDEVEEINDQWCRAVDQTKEAIQEILDLKDELGRSATAQLGKTVDVVKKLNRANELIVGLEHPTCDSCQQTIDGTVWTWCNECYNGHVPDAILVLQGELDTANARIKELEKLRDTTTDCLSVADATIVELRNHATLAYTSGQRATLTADLDKANGLLKNMEVQRDSYRGAMECIQVQRDEARAEVEKLKEGINEVLQNAYANTEKPSWYTRDVLRALLSETGSDGEVSK